MASHQALLVWTIENGAWDIVMKRGSLITDRASASEMGRAADPMLDEVADESFSVEAFFGIRQLLKCFGEWHPTRISIACTPVHCFRKAIIHEN